MLNPLLYFIFSHRHVRCPFVALLRERHSLVCSDLRQQKVLDLCMMILHNKNALCSRTDDQ